MAPLHIVRLDGVYFPAPSFEIPHAYTEYSTTSPSEVSSRIKDAEVILTTRVFLKAEHLSAEKSPNLKLVAVCAIGTDGIDLEACRKRGIRVANVPAASSVAVAEYAFVLYMGLRRRVVQIHDLVVEGKLWLEVGSCKSVYERGPPRSWKDEIVGIIGNGDMGKQISQMARALEMVVLLAERKHAKVVRQDRTPFEEVIRRSTVLMVTAPLTPDTKSLISTPEFDAMHPDCLLINVSRADLVNEPALIHALRSGHISGFGTDVFEIEPAGTENSALVKFAAEKGPGSEKVILSPHLAWYANSSVQRLREVTTANVEGWKEGEDEKVCWIV